jgi:hypothetical protein
MPFRARLSSPGQSYPTERVRRRPQFLLAALAALIEAGPASAEQDPSADPPALVRSCTDINGNTFGWQWSNAPFASTCAGGPVQDVVARSSNSVCQNSCAEAAIACIASTFEQNHAQGCPDNLAICQKSCSSVRMPR